MLLHTITTELNLNEDEIKACFFTELNRLYSRKKGLINFLTILSTQRSFHTIKDQLIELQEELKQHTQQLVSISLLAQHTTPIDQSNEGESGLLESTMLNGENVFNVKTKLSLLLYMTMAEKKEVVSLKKLKAYAQMLNYGRCLNILNQPESLTLNSGRLVEKVGGFMTKIAVKA